MSLIELCAVTLTAAVLLLPGAAGASEWHRRLYLDGGGYWRQRVRVELRNDADRAARGEPVGVPVGNGAGQVALVGAAAESVRVCDADGTGMLFALTGPGGRLVTRGPVPVGGTLAIPAECPPGSVAAYYVYFDNPQAWAVPDHLGVLLGVRNGGLEEGDGDVPLGWRHDWGDEDHRALWVGEDPHSGQRCLKTAVALGAEPTWIATRQHGIHITGGAQYDMEAWVKAEGVEGFAGWYIHVGNKDDPMLIGPMLSGDGGTYDWKKVSLRFTAPEGATIASLGTVLRGTGTAWFDDVTLECLTPSRLTAAAQEPETLDLRERGADAPWYDDDPDDGIYWDCRIPVRVINTSARALDSLLVPVDLGAALARWRGRLAGDSVRAADGTIPLPFYLSRDLLLFEVGVPPRTVQTCYLYLSADDGIQADAGSDYSGLVQGARNLVVNPDFGLGDILPDQWPGGTEGARPAGATMSLAQPSLFGGRCARVHVPHSAQKAWIGWRQDVPVEPGRAYLYAAWVRCEDVRGGSVRIHAHYRNAAGELCETMKHTGAGPDITGTTDWTLMSGIFEMPEDVATFQLHLTMHATGTVWHDGVLLVETVPGMLGPLEAGNDREGQGLTVWPVNAIVKVFQDDPPPRRIAGARISAARNEKEPIQLAVRSARDLEDVRVEVDPPRNQAGEKLTDLHVGLVGYVPIDHKTDYYSSDAPPWRRKYPTGPGAGDGWAGMWPDPLLPRDAFDLKANTTQPLWVTVGIPKDAAAGDYAGEIRLVHRGTVLKAVPFSVHVWDFTLPDESHVGAVYDLRLGGQWSLRGRTRRQVREQFWRFMADRRVCPDRISPDPVLKYENGQVVADFTEYDEAAEYYFDELKMPYTYTPAAFYLFGWAHPPRSRFGEEPYDGDYPYDGVDRSRLRPEFKRAYQACLRAYWGHMKERGWDDRCVLYISDEPHFRHPHIREQMRALCDMVHEVDPDIPIYSSTWHHLPEWDGYLDVWGIGHHGPVSPEKMEELRSSGDRLWFTTDGQMCTDTPYCAVERLLPHYCFHYGVEAYEFWGVNWLTYDPYEFGWHSYIRQSSEPGTSTWVRYPNGDGFLAYPGAPIGHDGPVSSLRLEQAREGVEDYEYLYLLRTLVEEARAAGKDAAEGRRALEMAAKLVTIPNPGGRYSTRILPNPDAVLEVKERLATAIEALTE